MVILYSSHCPKCNVLEKKLKAKNIDFQEVDDLEVMIKKGFKEAPKLELEDGTILDFQSANEWVNNYEHRV